MLGKRVRQLRLERGMSLSELAESAGVAKSYLSKIERDLQSNPSIHVLEKIASVLNVPLEDLFHPQNQDHTGPELKEGWYALIREAIEAGVSQEELKTLIEYKKWKDMQKKKDLRKKKEE